jgi:hypothetical protein
MRHKNKSNNRGKVCSKPFEGILDSGDLDLVKNTISHQIFIIFFGRITDVVIASKRDKLPIQIEVVSCVPINSGRMRA